MSNNIIVKCKHCGKELPQDHKGPCPYCGKMSKNFIATAIVSIGVAASFNAQKVHKYTKKHPRVIAISLALTIVSLIVGLLLGGLVGLLIGIIIAIATWWLAPYARETIVEIISWGDKGRVSGEAKTENDAQQQKGYSHKDIYSKLQSIEEMVGSSSRTQKSVFLYALGAAFVILGLSHWPGLLEHIGMDTARFYLINPVAFIVLGFIAIIRALMFQRTKKK